MTRLLDIVVLQPDRASDEAARDRPHRGKKQHAQQQPGQREAATRVAISSGAAQFATGRPKSTTRNAEAQVIERTSWRRMSERRIDSLCTLSSEWEAGADMRA